jgi:hypothetical protein
MENAHCSACSKTIDQPVSTSLDGRDPRGVILFSVVIEAEQRLVVIRCIQVSRDFKPENSFIF